MRLRRNIFGFLVLICPHKRNHFYTLQLHIAWVLDNLFFFSWASYSSFFQPHYSKENFKWLTSQSLESMQAHKWQLGSCSPDWRRSGCVWFVMGITYNANYCSINATVSSASDTLRGIFSWVVYLNLIFMKSGKQ